MKATLSLLHAVATWAALLVTIGAAVSLAPVLSAVVIACAATVEVLDRLLD